jgi:hypothetical protein
MWQMRRDETRSRESRVGKAALLGVLGLLGVLSCTAEVIGGFNPSHGIPQLVIVPRTINFRWTPGTAAPAPQTTGIVASVNSVDGLQIGTILYSPIVSGWLTADLVSGVTNTPTSVQFAVVPPSDLGPGTYEARVPIGSTVAGVQEQFVVVTLTVDSIPSIDLSPDAVTITAQQGGSNPAPQFIQVDNGAGGTLNGLSVGTISYGPGATGWLTAALNQATAPATLTLQATSASLATGTYTALVPVLSSIAGVPPDTVTVSLGVSATAVPPTIVASPETLRVSATAGGANPASQLISVLNAGGGTLSGLSLGGIIYQTAPGGWLNVTLNQTTAPATITAQLTTGSLAAATHRARVPVSSSLPGVKPDTVDIIFTVAQSQVPPLISVAPNAVTFTTTQGTTNPTPATLQVTNAGGGNLTQLSVGAITYGPGATGWLSAQLSLTGAPSTLTLTPTLGSLAAGTYTATVPVQSAIIGVAPVNVTVTFQVLPPVVPPAIGLSPTTLSFTAQQGGGNPAGKTVTVTNSGGGTLNGLAVGTITYGTGQPTGWVNASLSGTTAPATLTVTPTTGALAPGNYSATVRVTSGVASNSPRTVTVNFSVTAPPSIVLSRSTTTITGTVGQPNPSPVTITVTNGGAGTLSGLQAGPVAYGAGQPTGWLATSLSSGTTPTTLVLTPSVGSLAPGTYTATVPVTSTTPGVTAKSVAVTFQVGAAAGGLVILGGNNQSGLVNSTLPVKLRAQVQNAAGVPQAGVTVVWQVFNGGTLSNVVSVSDAQGEVSATWKVGPLAGIHIVTVSGAGLSPVTFQADVLLPSNPGAHPNEPPGFVAFAEHNFSALPTTTSSLGGLLGRWFSTGSSNLTLVTPDLTAPASPPNIMQSKYPIGLDGGRAPVHISGWDASGSAKSKVYMSLWLRIKGPNYENQATGTKMGFIAFNQDAGTAQNQGTFFLLSNSSAQEIDTSFRVQFRIQSPCCRNLGQNVIGSRLFTVGPWHHWEAVLELNTPGSANGVLKMWIDGVLVANHTDVVYVDPAHTLGFYMWKWNPTWGGTGGTKTKDDYILIDHVYFSGQ